MIRRQAVAIFVLLAFLLAGAGASQAASLDQLQARHSRLQQEIGSERSAINVTDETAQQVQSRLDAVDASLAAARSRLTGIEAREMQVGASLTAGMGQLALLKTELEVQTQKVDGVLRFTQLNGPETYLSVVLGAHSYAEFVGRLVYLRAILSYQTAVMQKYHAEKTNEVRQVTQLKQEHSSLSALARTAGEAADTYRTEAAKRQSLLVALSRRRTLEESLVGRLEKQDTSLMKAIKQLEEAVYKHDVPPGKIGAIVTAVAQQYGVDPALIWDIIRQESGGNADAVSRAGAEGLMQLMPGTAAELGVTDPLDPKQNIKGGVAYFARLLKQFHGDVALALAAYNAGPGAVKKYGGIPPYAETQKYVKDILSQYQKTASSGPSR